MNPGVCAGHIWLAVRTRLGRELCTSVLFWLERWSSWVHQCEGLKIIYGHHSQLSPRAEYDGHAGSWFVRFSLIYIENILNYNMAILAMLVVLVGNAGRAGHAGRACW